MKKILMGMIALMLIGNASFATDKKTPAKKAKTECKTTTCSKDKKDCKRECTKVCTPSCNK
jgi:hypothetical protein